MLIDLIEVRPDLSMPKQFFEITICTAAPLPNSCEVVIERPGQDKPYLASSGWQANYIRLKVVLRKDVTPHCGLRLPRDILHFFETGYNYKMCLHDLQDGELGFFVVSWDPSRELLNQQSIPTQPVAAPPIQVLETELLASEEPKSILDQKPEVMLNPVQKLKPISDRPRVVMRCKKCGGEIFSTFASCPYCGTTVMTENNF